MLLNISYKTEFKIDGVLNAGYQRVILSPKSSNSQKVNNWELNVTGGVKEILTNDHFNNHVNLIRISDDSNKIIVKVEGEVNTFNTHGISEINKILVKVSTADFLFPISIILNILSITQIFLLDNLMFLS